MRPATRLMKFIVTSWGVSREEWLTPYEAELLASKCRHPTRRNSGDSIVPMADALVVLE